METAEGFRLLGGCVDRGIATMRLALGYKKPLPTGWKPTPIRTNVELISGLNTCFPSRLILVYVYDPAKFAGDHRLDGVLFTCDKWMNLLDTSHWLFAFAYWGNNVIGINGRPDCHFVVGCPVDMKGYLKVPLAIAVSLDEVEMGQWLLNEEKER